MSVWSPIIFIASLLAPTVPSEPRPQNLHLTVPGEETFIIAGVSKDLNVTSSTIPIVKSFFGSSALRLSYTANI